MVSRCSSHYSTVVSIEMFMFLVIPGATIQPLKKAAVFFCHDYKFQSGLFTVCQLNL